MSVSGYTCVRIFVVTLGSSWLGDVRTKTRATLAYPSSVTLILGNAFDFFAFAQVATLAYTGTIAFIVAYV